MTSCLHYRLLAIVAAFAIVVSSAAGGTADNRQVLELRRYIDLKRSRTWQHQDYLQTRRFPTHYRERTTTGRAYLRWIADLWRVRAHTAWQIVIWVRTPEGAIRFVFGPYAEQALAVAKCESGYSMTPQAQNGQYLGIFQMGDYARSRYGHGATPLEQARAAYRYFVDSGRDWSPWSCRP